jgi:hypothetical protein
MARIFPIVPTTAKPISFLSFFAFMLLSLRLDFPGFARRAHHKLAVGGGVYEDGYCVSRIFRNGRER